MRILIVVAVFGVLVASAAAAQTLDEFRMRCEGRVESSPPINPDPRIASCTALIESGQETTFGLARAFRNRGIRYAVNRDYRRAITDYGEAIRLDPDYLAAYGFRARAYSALGDNDRAIEDYTEVIRLRPDLWTAFYRRGRVHAVKGNNERAIEDYGRALRLNSNFNRMSIFFYRGDAHRALGDVDRAIEDYDMTLRISPSYRCAWHRRGLAYREKGDEARAQQDLSRAARLHGELARNYPATRYAPPELCSPEQP